jgi:hypothetical protein
MATHEREITEPVDLCMPDGRHLNPEAKGWSRHPLHNGNLAGRWGRTKRWDYWGVLAGDLLIAVTYADVDYLGIANVWWHDMATGRTGGHDRPNPGARGISLPDRPGTAPLTFRDSSGFDIAIIDDPATGDRPAATLINARWVDRGRPAELDVRIELPAGHESLNVVIPWSSTTFQYTSKHQARRAVGRMQVGDETFRIGGDGPDANEAWGVLDVGRGRWPYSTRWNWAGGAGRAVDGQTVIGIQMGAKWTEGTGHTENGMIVDGRLNKIGEELRWDYSWEDPMRPWHVTGASGEVDLTLTPRYDKHSRVNALFLATEVHQVFGTWSGHVTGEDGTRHEVDGIQGFAEESRSRW